MKPKFTPGPWKAEMTNNFSGIEIWNHNTKVAEINTKTLAGRQVVAPNATLIAAAPEMFGALESLLERLSHLKNLNGVQDVIAKQVDDCKEVLKKARGE